jgi:hypothetical protein
LRYLKPYTRAEDIALIFENYQVRPKGIDAIFLNDGYKHFLVHFVSPEEAERAVAEQGVTKINGQTIKMTWYQC